VIVPRFRRRRTSRLRPFVILIRRADCIFTGTGRLNGADRLIRRRTYRCHRRTDAMSVLESWAVKTRDS
jgi:hypothetical protein